MNAATHKRDTDLAAFCARYRYARDARDCWTLLDAPQGQLHGDCEDFALSVLWIMAGRSWWHLWWWVITGQAMIWNARFDGHGAAHAMLWLRGHGWICSYYRMWSAAPHHARVFPYVAPLLAAVLILK